MDERKDKLKNKIYGLLCEREKGGNWEEFLNNILIELGNYENKELNIFYYVLYSKLSLSKYLSLKYFKKIIFECINLVERADLP